MLAAAGATRSETGGIRVWRRPCYHAAAKCTQIIGWQHSDPSKKNFWARFTRRACIKAGRVAMVLSRTQPNRIDWKPLWLRRFSGEACMGSAYSRSPLPQTWLYRPYICLAWLSFHVWMDSCMLWQNPACIVAVGTAHPKEGLLL